MNYQNHTQGHPVDSYPQSHHVNTHAAHHVAPHHSPVHHEVHHQGGNHVAVHANHQPTNYSAFPSPIPHSPLKESPLSRAVPGCPCDYHAEHLHSSAVTDSYPPFKGHGTVHVAHEVHTDAHIKARSGGSVVVHSGSDSVFSPYYNSQLSYQPVSEQQNSLAPLQGVHLYHHPDSCDSMKARMTLEEKGVKWTSEIINVPANAQFDAEYMSMNPRGTVPTLVVDNRVNTDGRNIVYYVNKTFPGPNMVPSNTAEVEVMEHFIDLADRQNLEALTFGKVEGVKKRTFKSPYGKRRALVRVHQEKNSQNRHLVEAYKQKEQVVHYQDEIVTSPSKMKSCFGNVQAMLVETENQLSNGPFAYGGWLASDQFTLADIHVLCFLYYLEFLGLRNVFGTNTERYYVQGRTRQSFVSAGDEWTSAYGRVTKQYVPAATKTGKKNKKCIMTTMMGLVGMALFGLLSWMTYSFCGKRKAKKQQQALELEIEHQKQLEIEAKSKYHADLDDVQAGAVSGWMKYVLLLIPLLCLVPLFLWCCGCIKCKKRSGRTRPRKAAVVPVRRSGSRSHSRSSSAGKKVIGVARGSHSSLSNKVRRSRSSSSSKKVVASAVRSSSSSS